MLHRRNTGPGIFYRNRNHTRPFCVSVEPELQS